MPIVKGPLFSLEASGTYGGGLTFSQTTGRSIARKTPRSRKPASLSQTMHRQQVADMALSWRQQSPATRTAWSDAAALLGNKGRHYFWSEWFVQNATLSSPPVIP